MKNIIFLLIMLIMISCGAQKIMSYNYNVVARGYKQNINVTQDSTQIIELSRSTKTTVTKTNPEFWKALQDASKNIELNQINTLDSPTNKRQFDGAMFAKLIISTNDSTYTSAGFDHGHPPAMIKAVVDSLVKL